MGIDRNIQSAIEVGQRNAEAFLLVKNWCAHVRIDRMGGGGMVEAATGLSIGHHGLACDHAPAGGMMCWDTRDAALDFYDRNCHACPLRQPVGEPNLGVWVAERDAAVAERKAEEAVAAREIANRLAGRQAERAALRSGLSPVAADVVDQVEELDLQRSDALAARLVETARLAPDAFPQAVVDHVFALLEAGERWFDDAGLQVLAILGADAARLANCAMACLQRWSATRTAARVLTFRLNNADESQVGGVLPTLIQLAVPPREIFSGRQKPLQAPLVRLNAAYPSQVAAALSTLLAGGAEQVSLASRALDVLAHRDTALAVRFARDLISKFVRAPWMPDPEDHGHGIEDTAAHDLREAIIEAFVRAPEAVHELLQNFRAGASPSGEVRIFSVYCRLLHVGQFRKVRTVRPADRLAFQTLLWEAPKTSNDRVLREIQGAIHDDPRDLVDLAAEAVDQLIGAAILMDARVVAFEAEEKPANAIMLDVMARSNRRGTLTALRSRFVSWGAAGAATAGKPAAYLDVLAGLPEGSDAFAACMIEQSIILADTAEGLNAILPTLYSGLVGRSVAGRGAAAHAIGELPRRQLDNMPDLLFEAFLTTLTDPYVYVHRSAVMALGRFSLPKALDARVRAALWNIVLCYAKSGDGEDILLEAIELLARRYLSDAQRSGAPGAFLVTLLAKMPSWRISNDIRWTARDLARADGLVGLLLGILLDPEATEYTEEHALEALADLPADVVYEARDKLAAVSTGTDRAARFRVFDLIQILSRCGAWAQAEQLSHAALAAIPDTVREASVRLMFELAHVAAAFENTQAQGDAARSAALAARWREVKAAKEANDHAIAQRPDPLGDLRRAPRSG